MAIVAELAALFKFETDKKSAQGAEASFRKLVGAAKAAVGVLAAGAVAKGINDLVEDVARLGDETAKTASKLGVNSQALQELRFAAEQTGVSSQALDVSLQRFTRRAAEAAKGSGEAKDALAQLGIRLRDNQGRLRPTEELLGEVADGFANTADEGERLRLATKLFDTEGAALVNTLKNGSGALNDFRQEARELGFVMDEDLLAASEAFQDSQNRLDKVLQGLKNVVGRELLPLFTENTEAIVKWFRANGAVIRQNLVKFIKQAVQVMGNLFDFTKRVVSSFVDFVSQMSPLQKGLLGIAAAAVGLALVLLLPGGSILLLIGLLALLIDDFETFRKGGDSVIGDLLGSFDQLLGGVGRTAAVFRTFFNFMLDAIDLVSQAMFAGIILPIEALGTLITQGPAAAFKTLQKNGEAIKGILGDAGKLGSSLGGQLDAIFGSPEGGVNQGLLQEAAAIAPAGTSTSSAFQQNQIILNNETNVASANATADEIQQAVVPNLVKSLQPVLRDVSNDIGVGTQ